MALAVSGCARENLSGRWQLTSAGSDVVLGRLRIDHVPTVLGHRGGDEKGIGSSFPAELVMLPDTLTPGQNPIFLLLTAPPGIVYQARRER